MIYELKRVDVPKGLQVKEQYNTLTGDILETDVLISTGLSPTLVTTETYNILSNEPLQPMEKNRNFGLRYIPTIPNPQRGIIKNFTLGGKLWGDLSVIVCDCEIGYQNQIILGTYILFSKFRAFSVDEKNMIIETR